MTTVTSSRSRAMKIGDFHNKRVRSMANMQAWYKMENMNISKLRKAGIKQTASTMIGGSLINNTSTMPATGVRLTLPTVRQKGGMTVEKGKAEGNIKRRRWTRKQNLNVGGLGATSHIANCRWSS